MQQNEKGFVEKIKKMHEAGIPKREIARRLGCSNSTVVYHTSAENKAKVLRYQKENKERFAEGKALDRTERKRRSSELMLEYLMEHPCVDCGETDPRVLEFDHREPEDKRANVAVLMRQEYAWHLVLKEIGKCDVRCANCHRIRTYEQFGSHRAAWTPEWLAEKGYC